MRRMLMNFSLRTLFRFIVPFSSFYKLAILEVHWQKYCALPKLHCSEFKCSAYSLRLVIWYLVGAVDADVV